MGEKEFMEGKELELLNKSSWELRDKPISSNVEETYLNPFTGEPTRIFKRDPRHKALRDLLEEFNYSNYKKASNKFNSDPKKYINVAILSWWDMIPMDRSKGDVCFTQEPCAYIDIYNSYDHIDEIKYIYRGKIRKGFKGKVFTIKEKGKNFYKVQDITSGKRYKFWPEDLQEIGSRYVVDFSLG